MRNSDVTYAAHPPPTSLSLASCRCDHPLMGSCGVHRNVKRLHISRRAGLHLSLTICPSLGSYPSHELFPLASSSRV